MDSLQGDAKLDDQLTQKFLEVDANKNTVIICIFNSQNQEIAKQLVNFSHESEQIPVGQKMDKVIRHTMQVKQTGLDHYNQVVEEVLRNGNYSLVIKNQGKDEAGEEIKVSPTFLGNSYYSNLVTTFLNEDGMRKSTIEIKNDRG